MADLPARVPRSNGGEREATHAARAYGPSALGGDVRRFVELTLTLARTEFKLRYFGSVLGYVWSLMRPLLFFGVLYLFFTQDPQGRQGRPALRRLPADRRSCSGTTSPRRRRTRCTCLVAREALLRKIRFPRMVIPLSVSLTATFNLGDELHRRDRVRAGQRRHAERQLAGADPDRARRSSCSPPASGCCCRRCTSATATCSRSGRCALQAWFYCSPVMYVAAALQRPSFGGQRSETARNRMLNPAATLL